MEGSQEYRVLFYKDGRGRCPVEEFLVSLPEKVPGKITKWIARLELLGPCMPRPHADLVRGKLRELRIIFASGQYRLLYFFSGKDIVITNGFVKKTDTVPEGELDRAERYMFDYEHRIRNEVMGA